MFPLAAASELHVPDSRFADSPRPDVDIARVNESSIDVQPVIIAGLVNYRQMVKSSIVQGNLGLEQPLLGRA